MLSVKSVFDMYKKQALDILKSIIKYVEETVVYFLRGLYDSEGSNYRCRQIFLSNNNTVLLHYVQYLLKKYFSIIATGLHISTKAGAENEMGNRKTIKTKHNNYQISINRKQHVQRFLSMIGFSITEKQLGLKRRK